jgi:proteasome lid subunit RPN8/RPN11
LLPELNMSEVKFGTWSGAFTPLTIEYSLVVIEEIRHEVAEGFQKLSRGGIEVGGLLYGVHDGKAVRILAIRPAACEHANGPAFRLSERDRAALAEQMRHDQQDPRLEGLTCVGWYVSHTRTEINLSDSDREIFSTYFKQPWQVTLVIRPVRGGNMRAGFFVWEPDGSVNASQSYLEFSFPDRLASFDSRTEHRGSFAERKAMERRPEIRPEPRPQPGLEPRPFARPVEQTVSPPAPEPAAYSPNSAPASSTITTLFGDTTPRSEPAVPEEIFERAGSKKPSSAKKWFAAAAVLIVIAALALGGARYFSVAPSNESIGLTVLEREGQLEIGWNRAAAPVTKAIRGTLEITDGSRARTIPLTPADLALGKFSYKRETGDIQVRMNVEQADGTKVPEASRFLGPPPSKANADELKALEQRRDELEAEIARLKQANDQQSQRIQQLERTLKILQTRPGVN